MNTKKVKESFKELVTAIITHGHFDCDCDDCKKVCRILKKLYNDIYHKKTVELAKKLRGEKNG